MKKSFTAFEDCMISGARISECAAANGKIDEHPPHSVNGSARF
jgi:hypothetical protein